MGNLRCIFAKLIAMPLSVGSGSLGLPEIPPTRPLTAYKGGESFQQSFHNKSTLPSLSKNGSECSRCSGIKPATIYNNHCCAFWSDLPTEEETFCHITSLSGNTVIL